MPPDSYESPHDSPPSLEELRTIDSRINQEAWNRAYPHLWQTAIQLLRFVLAGPEHDRNREDIASRAISELVHSFLEKNLASFNQLRSFDDLQGMTRQIVRARTKDFFRGRARRPEELTAEPPETALAPDCFAEPSSLEDFEMLIARLPSEQAQVFRLHYADGHTADSIAALLGRPRSTILSHLFRGRQTLRQHLETLGGQAAFRGSRPSAP